jgi:hypothetical protein
MSTTRVITGPNTRFSYANVWEPKQVAGQGDAKYSCALLIPKTDTKTLAKVEAAIVEALEKGKAKFTGGKIPKGWKNPLRDGDTDPKTEDDENYAGHYFLNANNKDKPQIVDKDLNEIVDKREFYSGCYGKACVSFFAYNTAGNQGVGVALENLMKVSDGEPLGGSAPSAADAFGSDDEDPLD